MALNEFYCRSINFGSNTNEALRGFDSKEDQRAIKNGYYFKK